MNRNGTSKELEDDMRSARISACHAVESFILQQANGMTNVYQLAVAAYYAGRARAIFEVTDCIVDPLEAKYEALCKKTRKEKAPS